MPPEELLIFLCFTLAASYIQAVAGFAFGLILMGAASVLGLAPIGFAAIVVSFTSLVNILVALRGRRRQILGDVAVALLVGLVPGLALGVWLLAYLSNHATDALRLLLGLTILGGGLVLMLRPSPYRQRSRGWTFALTGFMGGVSGGLFSVAGPPIVFHLYRQPEVMLRLSSTLLMVFGVATLGRILLVGLQGQITEAVLTTSALAIPVVVAGTLAGRHFPPPLSETELRRLCFLLLTFTGGALVFG
ncbi:sulfite exporter TauE/SafE family protein [Motiliproteus sp. SC1-56]|uniref:sulfite exporter TauE/SafE family protein n=1 Tax=Motiliproteus sp. SC1-56 TaxID=2799565 RepID=UPI001A9054A7|nr:sulfite exporter TauE/SafE family protein [Motiliproteus sp. SC1-56]